MSDFNIEALAAEIDSGKFGSSEGTTDQIQVPISSTLDTKTEYEYPANGKVIKEPLEMIFKRASMGYNYAQLVQQHKQREAEIAQREQVLKESEGRWKPYDEYAQSNPQWADFVRSQWDSRFNQQQAQQNASQWQPNIQQQDASQQQAQQAGLSPEIAQKLSQIDTFIGQYQAEKQAAAQAEADVALNSEVESIQKQFPDIDLRATDPTTGESLEMQVLKHAQLHGINSFEAAFKHMNFDRLMARAEMKAKENATKTLQTNIKKGFLAQSDKPLLQGDISNPGIKTRSYYDLMDIASKEMGFS